MAAGIYNIEIEQGANFQFEINIDGDSDFDDAFDTAAVTYIATVRNKHADVSAGAKFTVAKAQAGSPLINTVTLSLIDTATAALSSGKQYWDLLQTDTSKTPDERKRILQGNVIVTPQVTKSSD